MKSEPILWCRGLLGIMAGSVLVVGGCNNQNAEVAAQRQKELESVRAELEQARASVAARDEELIRLRKDNEDLLRLRNEVRQLRDKEKQLTQQAQTAQVQAQQAQAQVQAVQSQAQQTAQALAAQQQAVAQQQQANVCINQLRQIDGAKQQWALENRRDANAIPTAKDVSGFLKGAIPKCPAGGAYNLNAVGAIPTCTIPGHALPQ